MRTESILEEVVNERRRQNEKWGEQNHSPVEWLSILMEEVGEVSKEAVDFHFKAPYKEHGLTLPVSENHIVQVIRLKRYREELIQVAAVTIQMIECLDRNQNITIK